LPYPPHKQLQSTMLFIHPSKRGHFYFVKKGTFLLWLDRTGKLFFAPWLAERNRKEECASLAKLALYPHLSLVLFSN
jgi:hypothetical protein